MRKIVNFALTFAVIYFGNYLFSESVVCDSIKTVVLATVIIYGVEMVIVWLLGVSATLVPVGIGCLTIIPTMFVAMFSTPLTLHYMDKHLDGFSIIGTWAFILLWGIISFFRVSSPSSSSKKSEE